MKQQLTFVIAGFLMLTVTACMSAQMADHTMQNDNAMTEQTMSEKAMDNTSMAESEAMTDTMMSENDDMTDTMAMTDTMMNESHAMSETESMAGETMQENAKDGETKDGEMNNTAMMESPAWMNLPLTDVRTGESMMLSDLKGKTVFVETMATWCPNCRTQLGNVKTAKAQINDPNVVFIAISVETDLAAEQLAQYANNNSFDWFFAVSSPELLTALADAFGPTIATPPATPHFVLKADGTVGTLSTGIESSDQILAGLQK